MKRLHVSVLALAVAFYCAPAWAQHGHPGGMGGSTAGGMGHGASSHTMNTNANTNSNPGSAHGATVNQILTKNKALAGKIQTLTGMGAQQACDGFKNLGQCVAAAHVSKNLGISFDCLKGNMTGTAPAQGTSCPAGTGTNKMSLGKAIQTMSPHANSKTEAKKATQQADDDIKNSSS
jgi:hypothetical protein